jgi:peptidoglycan/xylan/chitin deacetylase (PgdA/CDA1 family)
MKASSILFAIRAKGMGAFLRRARDLVGKYGFTPGKMDRALAMFSEILEQFGCGATFPLTTVALKRNSDVIVKYLDRNIEFAVHGYTHVDYSQLAPEEQLAHLRLARQVFSDFGIKAVGFRSPYLRRSDQLYETIASAGFSYVSNQPVMWNVLESSTFVPPDCESYERAIVFYAPWQASERLSLPQLGSGLVEIPVSLPDDEMLLDRLEGVGSDLVEKVWQSILTKTYSRGELFTIQLHPERIAGCAEGLSAVLARARQFVPSVWFARLDEIAAWWTARAAAMVQVEDIGGDQFEVFVQGPPGTTVLARAVQVDAPVAPWRDGYQQVGALRFVLQARSRPFIGLAPNSSPDLLRFLREQGYITEVSQERQLYSCYFDQTEFTPEQGLALLAQIETSDRPLVRLGRWPNGAQSALSITGDIDALTLWDYGLRLLGR